MSTQNIIKTSNRPWLSYLRDEQEKDSHIRSMESRQSCPRISAINDRSSGAKDLGFLCCLLFKFRKICTEGNKENEVPDEITAASNGAVIGYLLLVIGSEGRRRFRPPDNY
jgi:hypothetical protein